jgi:hypothetical protein
MGAYVVRAAVDGGPAGDEPVAAVPVPRKALGRRYEWWLVVLGAALLAIAMNWQCVLHPSDTVPMDLGDPLLQAWQMAWAGHAIGTDPAQLWQANTFFPDRYSFAFSDTLFGYLPAGLIGSGPVAAVIRYNIMFLFLQTLALIGPYALVRQLGAGRGAAVIAGAAFAYAPWRWAQAGHMHVLSDGGMALALALLALGHGFSFINGYRPERARPGWAFAGWCVAAWQVSLGFGIGMPFVYVLGGATVVVAVRWWWRSRRGRPVPGRRVLVADGLGLALFAAVAGFMAYPYLRVLQLYPEARRGTADINVFSPGLTSFIIAPAQSLLWGRPFAALREVQFAPAEKSLLPGFALLALAGVGLGYSVWSRRLRLWLAGGLVGSMVLAMGTKFLGGGFTYLLLLRYAPGWAGIRTPGRLVVWTTLVLVVLAAGAVVRFQRGAGRRPLLRLAPVLPLLLILVEGINTVPHPVVPPVPAGFNQAAGPVMVLSTSDFLPMLWSTGDFPRMVNGTSGFPPRQQAAAVAAAASFPDRSSVDYLRRLGVHAVIVVKDLAGPAYARAAAPDPAARDLGITWRDYVDSVVYVL